MSMSFPQRTVKRQDEELKIKGYDNLITEMRRKFTSLNREVNDCKDNDVGDHISLGTSSCKNAGI